MELQRTPKEIGNILNNNILYCPLKNIMDYVEMPREKRQELIENRANYLVKKEWQRWTPGVGFYRIIKDIIKDDSELLNLIYSKKRNVANVVLNVAEFAGIAYGISAFIK